MKQQEGPTRSSRSVSFHGRVNVRIIPDREEWSSEKAIRDENNARWYSDQEQSLFRKSYCKLVVALDKRCASVSDDDSLSSDQDVTRVLYALQPVKSRKIRKERIIMCRFAVLKEQERQWTDENDDVELIASLSRTSSAVSIQEAQIRGDLVARSELSEESSTQGNNTWTNNKKRSSFRGRSLRSRAGTLLRTPSPMPRPRRRSRRKESLA
jgi:hypothetical protein